MPAVWMTERGAPAQTGAPPLCGQPAEGAVVAQVVLRPHRSLSPRGFAVVILLTWLLCLVPLAPLLGTPALWVMLPFLLAILAALWVSIRRNMRDGALCEELVLWPDRIRVRRLDPCGTERRWEANPYWTRLGLRPEGGPVENYLTLKGNGREIELGAFLSPDERVVLHRNLERVLAHLRNRPFMPD